MRPGFTLIELIVASGIYMGIALVGLAVMANTEQIRAKTETQGDMIEAAGLSLEILARQVRFGSFTIENDDGSVAAIGPGTSQRLGTRLALTLPDPATGAAVTSYVVVSESPRPGNPHHHLLNFVTCGDAACQTATGNGPLTPDGIEVDAVSFRGGDDAAGDRTPYVQMTLTLHPPGLNQPPVVIHTTISRRRTS